MCSLSFSETNYVQNLFLLFNIKYAPNYSSTIGMNLIIIKEHIIVKLLPIWDAHYDKYHSIHLT